MLTTSLRRLRGDGVAGAGVWSYYGLSNTLASQSWSVLDRVAALFFFWRFWQIASPNLWRWDAHRRENRLSVLGARENRGALLLEATTVICTIAENTDCRGEARGTGQNRSSPPSGGHSNARGQHCRCIPRTPTLTLLRRPRPAPFTDNPGK